MLRNRIYHKDDVLKAWKYIFFTAVMLLMVIFCTCDEEESTELPPDDQETLPLEFSLSQTIQGTWIPKNIFLGDFDGDGDLDMFVSCIENSSFILWNTGGGQVSAPDWSNNFGESWAGAVDDLDADNDLDLVLNNPDTRTTRAWINDGTGRFLSMPPFEWGLETISMALGDLDSDNDIDLYIGSVAGSDQIYLNNGTGVFSLSNQTFNSELTMRAALGDLDRDNDLDAVIAKGPGTINMVCINDGAGRFTAYDNRLGLSVSSLAVVLADFDLDNDNDIFLGYHDGEDSLWMNNGDATFVNANQRLSTAWSYDAKAGDLNADGFPDLAVAGGNSQDSIWLNNGSGRLQQISVPFIGNQGGAVELGDLDLDGDLDVVFIHDPGNSNTGKVYIWKTTINHQMEYQSAHLAEPCETDIFDFTFTGLIGSINFDSPVAVLKNLMTQEIFPVRKEEEISGFILTAITPEFVMMQNREGSLKIIKGRRPTIQFTGQEDQNNSPAERINSIEKIKTGIQSQTREYYREMKRDEAKRFIKKDWRFFLDNSTLIPALSEGKIIGLKLLRVPEHGIIAKFGLKSNDILTEVNGFELKNPDVLFSLYKQLRHNSKFTLKIVRKGKKQTYRIVLK